MIFVVLLLCVSPFFFNYFIRNLEKREAHFEKTGGLENEGRIVEFQIIVDEVFNSPNVKTVLLGRETFNLVGTYAGGMFGRRMIHNDYAKLINGTGLLGMCFWIFIFGYLCFYMFRLSKSINFRRDIFSLYLFALFYTYLIVFLVSMVSGAIQLVLSPSFFFTFIGAVLRLFYNKKLRGIMHT